ncbi:glycerophosphodiester phosphodiesterase family protein [uncultured Actinomyces sp.]|uniref:glycerophosphodiester phosphodiesterase n=1 Tax=uncultured Actinomyces sp. TaxID=249061 RepID=UPI0028D17346|nr:glycerophosphodiester phosphodiesterase family protein [uncultured Actinomyces sp.]
MPDVVVYERRRAGGDLPGVVRMRRRAGGDVSLSLRAPSTPVTPADDDIVSRFLAAHPFYVSHRMGGTEFPEFTQAGLDASLRAGFKALEISVRRCASGEFVAIHDWKTSRTVPGTDYQIWNTSWETLRGLRQASGGFMRLTDIVDQISDDVILTIDHKTTSSEDQRNPGDLASEEVLLEYLDTAFGGILSGASCGKFSCGGRARRARRRADTRP